MEFFLLLFYKTALYQAVQNNNIECVKLLLGKPNIDVNLMKI